VCTENSTSLSTVFANSLVGKVEVANESTESQAAVEAERTIYGGGNEDPA
jgi:hypothetical protein